MENIYIVESSSEEEDFDGNDGWQKKTTETIYDPKTMFLDLKPKKLPPSANQNKTVVHKLLIDHHNITLKGGDKDGNYGHILEINFSGDNNLKTHISGGFSNITSIHVDKFYLSPISSGLENGTIDDLKNYYTDGNTSPNSYSKFIKLSHTSAHPVSEIKGNTEFSSDSNFHWPGYLPRASYLDMVIEEIPSANVYQHNKRMVLERINYKYHEDGSHKDNLYVGLDTTNLHHISLDKLSFKFFLGGHSDIYINDDYTLHNQPNSEHKTKTKTKTSPALVTIEGGNIKITSQTTGSNSTVSINYKKSGTNAAALVQNGNDPTPGGEGTSGSYTGGSFHGYNFAQTSSSHENLYVNVDGIPYIIRLSTDLSGDIDHTVTYLNNALEHMVHFPEIPEEDHYALFHKDSNEFKKLSFKIKITTKNK